jgi:hypothetical protein
VPELTLYFEFSKKKMASTSFSKSSTSSSKAVGSVVAPPDSRKKQKIRLEKERRRCAARRARLQQTELSAASLSSLRSNESLKRVQSIWSLMKERLEQTSLAKSIPIPDNKAENNGKTIGRDPLRQFYKRAYSGTMTADVVTTAVAHSFFLDKFETRADEACGALLCLWERAEEAATMVDEAAINTWSILCKNKSRTSTNMILNENVSSPPPPVRVLSIGGGPGNDLAGFLVFNSLVLGATSVDATVFDFSLSWKEIVDDGIGCFSNLNDTTLTSFKSATSTTVALSDSNVVPSIKINFSLADLRAPIKDPVNEQLINAAPNADYFLFSYVARESQAAKYPLLGELFQKAKVGSVFLFLDPSIIDINIVTKAIEKYLPGRNQFRKISIGSHRLYPFVGVAFVILNRPKKQKYQPTTQQEFKQTMKDYQNSKRNEIGKPNDWGVSFITDMSKLCMNGNERSLE